MAVTSRTGIRAIYILARKRFGCAFGWILHVQMRKEALGEPVQVNGVDSEGESYVYMYIYMYLYIYMYRCTYIACTFTCEYSNTYICWKTGWMWRIYPPRPPPPPRSRLLGRPGAGGLRKAPGSGGVGVRKGQVSHE